MTTGTERALLGRGGICELVGRTEAAEILGVKRPNLATLKGFPAPIVDYLKAGKLYLRSDIEQFAETRVRRTSQKQAERRAQEVERQIELEEQEGAAA